MRSVVFGLALAFGVFPYAVAAQDKPLPQSAAPAETGSRPARIPTAAFAKSGGLSDLKLSADGAMIAMTAQINDQTSIAIMDAATKGFLNNFAVPDEHELEWYRWAGPRRLLISGGDADQPRTDGPVFGWRTSAAPWISRSPHLPVPMKGRHPQGAPLARHAHFSACTVDAPDRRHESMWVKSTRIRMGHRVIDMEQYMRLR